jgi:hypothetical protein
MHQHRTVCSGKSQISAMSRSLSVASAHFPEQSWPENIHLLDGHRYRMFPRHHGRCRRQRPTHRAALALSVADIGALVCSGGITIALSAAAALHYVLSLRCARAAALRPSVSLLLIAVSSQLDTRHPLGRSALCGRQAVMHITQWSSGSDEHLGGAGELSSESVGRPR